MNCAFDKEKLSGYYDGELEAAEKAEVERHIASCSECLRELGELKSAAVLVKELPRLRAPKSIAESVSREIQAAGKVHQFAKVRRTILWASAAAAALFIGLNIMYFSTADKSPAPMAASSPTPPVAKIQQERGPKEEALKSVVEKEAAAPTARRGASDREAADESKLREMRKSIEDFKDKPAARDDAGKRLAEPAPVERARSEKDKSEGSLALKGAEAKQAAAPSEPQAPPKPQAAPPPGAAPAPVAKQPATPAAPAPEMAEKAANKENLARVEAKKAGDPAAAAVEAPATHLTLASTQASRSRSELEAALKKMGVAMPPPPPAVKSMKAAPSPETNYSLELTDSQIARLKQELTKPGASRIVVGAPGDPVVLAEFGDGRMFGRKTEGAGVASGGAAAPKAKELGKADAKAETKDGGKDLDAAPRGVAEGVPADKSAEPRRKVVLHLIEMAYVPEVQPAPDSIKK